MELKWQPHKHIRGGIEAVGCRGTYTLLPKRGYWVLTGQLHDSLPMLAIPAEGKPFGSLDGAQAWAARLDVVTAVEPEISGT